LQRAVASVPSSAQYTKKQHTTAQPAANGPGNHRTGARGHGGYEAVKRNTIRPGKVRAQVREYNDKTASDPHTYTAKVNDYQARCSLQRSSARYEQCVLSKLDAIGYLETRANRSFRSRRLQAECAVHDPAPIRGLNEHRTISSRLVFPSAGEVAAREHRSSRELFNPLVDAADAAALPPRKSKTPVSQFGVKLNGGSGPLDFRSSTYLHPMPTHHSDMRRDQSIRPASHTADRLL